MIANILLKTLKEIILLQTTREISRKLAIEISNVNYGMFVQLVIGAFILWRIIILDINRKQNLSLIMLKPKNMVSNLYHI